MNSTGKKKMETCKAIPWHAPLRMEMLIFKFLFLERKLLDRLRSAVFIYLGRLADKAALRQIGRRQLHRRAHQMKREDGFGTDKQWRCNSTVVPPGILYSCIVHPCLDSSSVAGSAEFTLRMGHHEPPVSGPCKQADDELRGLNPTPTLPACSPCTSDP